MADYELGLARTVQVLAFPSPAPTPETTVPAWIASFSIPGVLARVQAVGVEKDLSREMGK